MYDVIIIGAGPAGLTAAIYTCRANKKTLVLEAKVYGGAIVETTQIENYPVAPHISGPNFAKTLYTQATELGAEVEFEEVVALRENATDSDRYFEITTEDDTYQAKSVIIAGGSIDRKLNLPNEKELTGRGVSYCATCDGALYKGKTVAVNGGGNTALYDALYLSDIAKKIYLIHRRNEFRGDPALVDKLKKKDNIEFIMDSVISKINGEKRLESIEISPVIRPVENPSKNSENTPVKPVENSKTKTLKIDGLFVAIGRAPATKIYKDLLKLDGNGYIVADEKCRTNVPGIFVAGDIRTKDIRQLVTATADGAITASAVAEYLNG